MKSGCVILTCLSVAGWCAAAEGQTAAPSAPSTASADESIDLAVGETHLLSARNVRNYSEGASGVIEIRFTADSAQFVLAGRRPGSTTLLLISNDGTQKSYAVHVFARQPDQVERELKQLLGGASNVVLNRVGSRHVIDGWVRDDAELQRINRVAALYPGQVESLVRVGAPQPDDSEDATAGAQRYLVRIDFYFVELDTSSSYAVGLGWPGSIGGANVLQGTGALDLLAGQFTQAAITVSQPLPRLDMAQSHGWGRVLKHVAVVTNSGAEAKFTSGGEQNFSVNTGLTIGLQSVRFGVELGVVPRYDPARGDFEVKIKSNVSDLTAAGPGTSIPGRTASTLDTEVNVPLGQSIVLSGIRTHSQTHHVDGLPLLSQIPVLGLLFGSHQNTASETEGAIYIVPTVVDSVRASSMELVDEAVRRFDEFRGDLSGVHLTPPPAAPAPKAARR